MKKEYLSEDTVYQDKVSVSCILSRWNRIEFAKQKELIKTYQYIRRTRGDGNCFYRAFGFGYLEENLTNKNELQRFRQLTIDLKTKLIQLGYLDFTVEDVSDVVCLFNWKINLLIELN